MIDLYCTDPDCDCRNVYIHVVHKGFSGPIATITYDWEKLSYYKKWIGGEEGDYILRQLLRGRVGAPPCSGKKEAKDIAVPWCLVGAGACPPEDVGGIHGYQRMLEVLKSPVIRKRPGISNGWALSLVKNGMRNSAELGK